MYRAIFIALLSCFFSLSAVAAVSDQGIMTPDFNDQASLQRGLKIYSNYCSGCHQLSYMRYKEISIDLGIPNALFEENLLPKYARIGDQITAAITPADAKRWFGAKAPDLTLEAKRRSPNWIYHYLQSFYQDKSRPLGVNNLLLKNVAMPNVLEHLQGQRLLQCKQGETAFKAGHGCRTVAEEIKGRISEQDFKQIAYDTANFLAYTADPSRFERESLGLKVLLFVALFIVFAYLLKKEFWRDVR
ncbi:Cytochrome c1 precursor [Marinomonas spartinae]|uniref:cytochrome c1 n=1 Tax=Marinomonas spartinae TaxID=1792290 RepID=UPI000808D272|nr:cytochrome c1 [Marinomonas spartinae]SBS37141.1 Cytochrome c1 precursor [Marinomonas spartinae]